MIRIVKSSTIINGTTIVEYLCEPYFAIDTSIMNIVHDIIILIARIKMSLRGTTNTARKQQQSRKRLKIKKETTETVWQMKTSAVKQQKANRKLKKTKRQTTT